MGTIRKFNTATTGPNAGLLRKVTKVDRREAPGVLFLGGPAHPAAPSAAGAVNGLRVRNAMWENAKTLIGSGDESTLGSSLEVPTAFGSGSSGKGLVERTGKGAIHGIVSQVQPLAKPGDGAVVQLDPALRTYMYANKGDQWYISMWARYTRGQVGYPATETGLFEVGAGSTSTDYILSLMTTSGFSRWGSLLGHGFWDGAAEHGGGQAIGNALQPVLRWGAGTGKTNPVASSYGRIGPSWGIYGGTYNGASPDGVKGYPSFILYEIFIDNLTKSARTYDQARALDREAFTEAFAAGGRYYNDTFTDPSTIP